MQLLIGDKVFATASGSNYGASYTSLPPGTYTFVVERSGDTANPLKKEAVMLRGDTYITYLVSQKNGQPAVEMIDDTPDPKTPDGPSRLAIRQFIPGARVTVATKEGNSSQAINFGENALLEGIPNQIEFLTMKATGLGPEAATWSTEADFTTTHHATLLIVADPYGRFRPRIAYDGWNGAAPTPKPARP